MFRTSRIAAALTVVAAALPAGVASAETSYSGATAINNGTVVINSSLRPMESIALNATVTPQQSSVGGVGKVSMQDITWF